MERGYQARHEIVVVEIALAEAQQTAVSDEAAELHAGDHERDGFSEDEVVGYLWTFWALWIGI